MSHIPSVEQCLKTMAEVEALLTAAYLGFKSPVSRVVTSSAVQYLEAARVQLEKHETEGLPITLGDLFGSDAWSANSISPWNRIILCVLGLNNRLKERHLRQGAIHVLGDCSLSAVVSGELIQVEIAQQGVFLGVVTLPESSTIQSYIHGGSKSMGADALVAIWLNLRTLTKENPEEFKHLVPLFAESIFKERCAQYLTPGDLIVKTHGRGYVLFHRKDRLRTPRLSVRTDLTDDELKAAFAALRVLKDTGVYS